MKNLKKVGLIDGNFLLIRSFFGALNNYYNEDLLNYAWRIVTNKIIDFQIKFNFDRLYFVMDGKRSMIDKFIKNKDYKTNRKKIEEEGFKRFLKSTRIVMPVLGLIMIKHEKYEADDSIASMASYFSSKGIESIIFSQDKDLFQLLGPHTKIVNFNLEDINSSFVKKRFKVSPERILDYLSIVGDQSDNIPGIRGLGAKAAERLINMGSLNQIFKRISSKIEENLTREEKIFKREVRSFFFSRYMIKLSRGIRFCSKLIRAKIPLEKNDKLILLLQENGYGTLLDKLKVWWNR